MTKAETFTRGLTGRTPHNGDFYNVGYFDGSRHDQGIQFPTNGAFLNPESAYQNKFKDLLTWITSHVPTGKILDVGTGPGHLAYWAKKLELPVTITGSDISLSLLRSQYNQNPNNSLCSTAFELPFAPQRFNGILFSDVLEHVWPEQATQAVNGAHRLLKPDGYIFINIPNRKTWSDAASRDEGHVWLPTISEMKKLLALGGFEETHTEFYTRGFPGSNIFRKINGHDLRLPIFGRSIFICAKK